MPVPRSTSLSPPPRRRHHRRATGGEKGPGWPRLPRRFVVPDESTGADERASSTGSGEKEDVSAASEIDRTNATRTRCRIGPVRSGSREGRTHVPESPFDADAQGGPPASGHALSGGGREQRRTSVYEVGHGQRSSEIPPEACKTGGRTGREPYPPCVHAGCQRRWTVRGDRPPESGRISSHTDFEVTDRPPEGRGQGLLASCAPLSGRIRTTIPRPRAQDSGPVDQRDTGVRPPPWDRYIRA
jgi:hypothetical protein